MLITDTIKIPKTKTIDVNHITEKEMYENYKNIYSWISDMNGIVQICVLDIDDDTQADH